MQLSADQLADFAAALRCSDRELPHDDRRRTPRLDVRARVIVSQIIDGKREKPQLMRLRDLSPRGVSMLHTDEMPRGQQFILTLPREGQQPVNILCTSVYSRPVAGRLKLIGAEFVCTLNSSAKSESQQIADDSDEVRIRSRMLE